MCIYLLKKNKSYTFNMNMYRLLYFSYSLIKPQKYLGPDEFCLLILGLYYLSFLPFWGWRVPEIHL